MSDRRPFDPNFNPERAAAGDPFPFDMAVTGLVEITDGPIEFTPAPIRRRRHCWTDGTSLPEADKVEEVEDPRVGPHQTLPHCQKCQIPLGRNPTAASAGQ